MYHIFSPVPANEVFPDSENDLAELKSILGNLGLHSTLALCAHLSVRLATIQQQINQEDLIHGFFDENRQNRIYRYFRNIDTEQRGAVFHRGQLLELIRWVCLFCDGEIESAFDTLEKRESFAHAALIANELWQNRVYKSWYADNGINRENSLAPIRQATSDGTPQVDMLRSFGRGKIMFTEIFERYYPHFRDEFQSITNLTIDEYYSLLFVIRGIHEYASESNEYLPIFISALSDLPSVGEKVSEFVQSESQTPEDLKSELWGDVTDVASLEDAPVYDLKPMRDKPILRFPNGQIAVIDLAFLTDKATIGPLFILLRQELRRNQAREIFSAFGLAFEDYVGQLFEKMYPSSQSGLFNRFERNYTGTSSDGNQVEIADVILNDINQSVLFELKAKWIRDDALLLEDSEKYIETIIQLYSNNKPKLQLANSIINLANGEWIPNTEPLSSGRIYPVLLSYDYLLSSLSYGWVFAEAFKSGLESDSVQDRGDMKKGEYSVTPLIVMTVDVLEDLEISVQSFSLCKLLSDYSAAIPDRTISLQQYLRNSQYDSLIDRRGTVMSKSLEIMDSTMKLIDPTRSADEFEDV